MANLIITDVCDMKCRYCFAGDHMQASKANAGPVFISCDIFEKHLDFLDRSGINEIRLLGGEPTLHPRFVELIQRAQVRNKHIVVFSHGLMSEQALACLEAIPPDACTVLVNMNATRHPNGPNETEQSRRRATLQRLGSRALLGFNIDTPHLQPDFLLPLILEMGCQKKIRLGLAQPVSGGSNHYLHPKQYPIVGQQIARFAQDAAQAGITLEFDCGFVRCMFSEDDLEILHHAQVDLHWRCSPILDIGIDSQVYHCFALAGNVRTRLADIDHAASLRQALTNVAQPYRAAGIYKECALCHFKHTDECTGGCLAATLKRFRPGTACHLTVPKEVFST